MPILFKYLWKNGTEHKMRAAVMLCSVLLSTTLLFVSLSSGTSYESAQRKMARGMAGSATISLTAVEGAIYTTDLPALSAIGNYVGILEQSALYHEDGYYETIEIIAADLTQLNQINPPRLLDCQMEAGFTGQQVILPERFTAKYGIEMGDKITLQINGEPVRLKVGAIAAYDTVFLRHTRGATALVPLSTLADLLGQSDGYHKVLLEPAPGVSTSQLKQQLEAMLSSETFRVSEIVNETQITADARQKSMPFFLISFFTLTISIFIIYSSYKVITLDRLPVLGTFRSIGATERAVTCLLLLESLLYGCMGGVLGIPAGILLLNIILQNMGHSLAQGIAIPVVITPVNVLLSFSVAVLVSLLAAWFPVRRASRLPLKELVLGTVEAQTTSKRKIVGIGALLLIGSWLLPRVAPETMLYPAGGLSLVGLLVAAILLVPLCINLVAAGLELFYGVVWGNEGKLAARNLKDNKNMTQTVTLLFISISAVIAIAVVGHFVTIYVGDVFRGATLDGFADGHMEQAFIEQVETLEGIEQVLPLYVFQNQIAANGISFKRLEATDHLDWYNAMLALHYTNDVSQAQILAAFAAERMILLSEDCLRRTGFSVGEQLTLTDGLQERVYMVAGSFKSRATDVEAIIPAVYAEQDFGAAEYDFLAYTAADPEAVIVQIRDMFGNTPNWSRTVDEFNTDALSTVGAFLQPMHRMTYLILLLATVGIMNNLLIHYLQKRRVLAIYRSIGLSQRQHIKMTLLEGFSGGLIGASMAILVSYLEIQTIFLVAGPKIQMVPEQDISVFLIAGILGVAITLLGSVVPILKSQQMNLVEEIKQT